jgi:putative oxidoreductase
VDAYLLDNAGRWLIVLYFATAWLFNCNRAAFEDHVRRMVAFGTPFPRTVFCVGMAMQIIGCVLLAAHWHADIGAWLLIVFTVLATAIFHRFWRMPDPQKRLFSRLNLLSNIGIVGGLLLLLRAVS